MTGRDRRIEPGRRPLPAVSDVTLDDFAPPSADGARSPRAALLWVPRERDVARIAALSREAAGLSREAAAGDVVPRVLDVGAGSGLLSRLLAERGIAVRAIDPGHAHARDVGRFFDVEPITAREAIAQERRAGRGRFDVAIASFMEAGVDYRAEVATAAEVVVSARDLDGMCGVKGDVDYAPFGLRLAESWSVPTFEDVAAMRRAAKRGIAVPSPRGVVEVWTRTAPARLAPFDRTASAAERYPWEPELDAVSSR